MNQNNPDALCTMHLLDDGIVEYRFHVSSREAVDVFFDLTEQTVLANQGSAMIRILFNSCESGVLPLMYTLNGLRALMQKHRFPMQRVAYLHNAPPSLTMLANTMMQIQQMMAPKDRHRYFACDQRDEALAWLTAEDTTPPTH